MAVCQHARPTCTRLDAPTCPLAALVVCALLCAGQHRHPTMVLFFILRIDLPTIPPVVVRSFTVLDGIGKGLNPRFDMTEIAGGLMRSRVG